MADQPGLSITVVWSAGPRLATELLINLPAGARVADALEVCRQRNAFEGLDVSDWDSGVWGRRAPPGQLLQANDRVELYRPLTVDPKVARRERFASQGARGTGLFAKKRDGAKAGY